jgi:PIN domain nuclease of toxin-antitoxin system
VRFVLDTHTFLWFIMGNEQLPQPTRAVIANMDHEIYLSIASLWEIAIKVSLGKLTLHKPFAELIPEQLRINELQILPINLNDLISVTQLPFIHRDPFDRLLIAQTIVNDLVLITKDETLSQYAVRAVWYT